MRLSSIVLCLMLAVMGLSKPVFCAEHDELPVNYITVADEHGNVIFETGLRVHIGDQFINEENQLYEVFAVDSHRATATHKGDLAKEMTSLLYAVPVQAQTEQPAPLISIYHTHTDESYIPSDGKASTPGKGSIMQVGEMFAAKLGELGYRVNHNQTLHEPHDANAYQRSRRTFVQLLSEQPATLFDLHRDSAPLRSYIARISGKDAAKLVLVVGQQNPNIKTIQSYAKQIKAAVDAKYQGLVKGIFIAHGNYNQDLMPRSMLVEVGTQYNTLASAEQSITLFAEALPSFIPLASAAPGQPSAESANELPQPGPAEYSYDITAILGTLAAGVAVYLFLSTGSWQEAKSKLKRFRNTEFTNFLGSLRRRRK